MSFSQEDIFDANLNTQIDNALVNLQNVEKKNDRNEISIPNHDNRERNKSSKTKVVVDGKTHDISLEPTDDELEEKVPPSPIQINAEKDSALLDLSLRIDPNIQCTRVKLKIPLQKSESGREKPVEVSANYTEIKSPVKQAQITNYFGSKKGLQDSGNSNIKSNDKSAKEKWNQIFDQRKSKSNSAKGSSKGEYFEYVKKEYESSQSQEDKRTKQHPYYKGLISHGRSQLS